MGDYKHLFKQKESLIVLSIGKAAHEMTKAFLELDLNVKEKLVLAKEENSGHPIPNHISFENGRKLETFLKKRKTNEHLVVLLSGGASALAELLPQAFEQPEIITLTQELLSSKASIDEINTIRKEISLLKNGGLLTLCPCEKITTLAINDIPTDEIHFIGSGPTLYLPLNKEQYERQIRKYLKSNQQKLIDWVKSDEYKRINHKKKNAFQQKNLHFEVISDFSSLKQETLQLFPKASFFEAPFNMPIERGLDWYQQQFKINPHQQLFSGGELTIDVLGKGKGGRNTHFVLCMSELLFERKNPKLPLEAVTLFSLATDGSDGPTTGAGAWMDFSSYQRAKGQGLNLREYLINFDSYTYFEKLGNLIETGRSGTNIMDLRMVSTL